MKSYEYTQLEFDFGDLAELNRLGSEGWKVVAVVQSHRSVLLGKQSLLHWALLERDTEEQK
jgi:hypothetical protein